MTDKGVHIIDCVKLPFVPDGWDIKEHQSYGKFEWDPDKIELYYPSSDCSDHITGDELFKWVQSERIALNAVVLDYLLDNPELISKEWEDKTILFFGTIYKQSDTCICVRALLWNGTKWIWGYMPFHWGTFSINSPAAVMKK